MKQAKKYFHIGLILILVACAKKNGKGDYCWHCECITPSTGQQSIKDTCMETKDVPQFTDGLGNDVNCACQEK